MLNIYSEFLTNTDPITDSSWDVFVSYITYLDVDVGHVIGRDEPAHDDRVAQRRPRVSDHFQPLVRSHLWDLKTIQSFM